MKSDIRLRQDVCNELKWDPSINDTCINIQVEKGLVTLVGYVDSFEEKWRAKEAVLRVHGVIGLEMMLEVKLLFSTERSDAEITKSAEGVVRWSNDLRNNSVKINVEKGLITLTGYVTWAFQKHNIERSLSNLMGVAGIDNLISIETQVIDLAVKKDIELALKRHRNEHIQNISISVNGSEVTLTGFIQSLAELKVINYIAWNTRGVKNVKNHIIIS
jgi:osmotically-inducible protein OsmY